MTTPADVLACKRPADAAEKFLAWLKEEHCAADAVLWSPERSAELGYGKVWSVCWEDGPFEWAPAVSMGSSLYAGEAGSYSTPGPFPEGLDAKGWRTEPWNNFIIGFYGD